MLRRYRSRRAWALTFLMMFYLRVKAKRPQKRQSFCSFVLFFLTTFELTNRLREKKRAELNQTALSVDEILLRSSGMPRAGGRHQLPVFFPRTLPQTTSQRPPEVRSWHVHCIRKSHYRKRGSASYIVRE